MAIESRKILKHYLGDIIYAANDGIITTFTIICGVQGAKLPYKVIIILGLINLLADGISMGASRFLSIRSKITILNENRPDFDATQHGFITTLAFIFFGSIPLISFFMPGFKDYKFIITIIICMMTLFLAGSLSYFINKIKWWKTGLEMAFIGGGTAVIAYQLGYILSLMIE